MLASASFQIFALAGGVGREIVLGNMYGGNVLHPLTTIGLGFQYNSSLRKLLNGSYM